jgi:integrase
MWVPVATTGMHRSELAGARRELLDIDASVLVTEPTRVVVAGRAEDSDGKTEGSRRTISLDPVTVEALRQHIAMLDQERKDFGSCDTESRLLFCHPDGTPLHPDTITRRFNALVDAAGVRRISPPRRTSYVRHHLARQRCEPKAGKRSGGSRKHGFTLSAYTHRSTGTDRSAQNVCRSRL